MYTLILFLSASTSGDVPGCLRMVSGSLASCRSVVMTTFSDDEKDLEEYPQTAADKRML